MKTTFKCPQCRGNEIAACQSECTVVSLITINAGTSEAEYNESEINQTGITEYGCATCDFVIPVDNDDDLIDWLTGD